MCYKLALRAKGILPIPANVELRTDHKKAPGHVVLVPNGSVRIGKAA